MAEFKIISYKYKFKDTKIVLIPTITLEIVNGKHISKTVRNFIFEFCFLKYKLGICVGNYN